MSKELTLEQETKLIVEDLQPVLSLLSKEDGQAIVELQPELIENIKNRTIWRTETQMRVSVLNDAKHPTKAAKWWQCVTEQTVMFENLVSHTFEIRRNHVKRLKLERKMEKAIAKGDDLKQMEVQIDLDENLVERSNLEGQIKNRIREVKLWSKLKNELDDGSFDKVDVNSHQAEAYVHRFKTNVQALGPNAGHGETLNAVGLYTTMERLKTEDGKSLKDFHGKNIELPEVQKQDLLEK